MTPLRPLLGSDRPALSGPGAAAIEVLVVGVDDWAISEAEDQLVSAGRKVHRCSDSVESPFPCNALVAGRGCPLDKAAVDVVLDVHTQARPKLALSEVGAICGLRHGLPLVVCGISDGSVLAAWAEQVPSGGDIVSTCDRAVAGAELMKDNAAVGRSL